MTAAKTQDDTALVTVEYHRY